MNLGGIAVYGNNPELLKEGLKIIREVELDRPIIIIIEDIDKIMKRHYEEEMLAVLDGECQVENVVYVATTNYIEDLPPRVVNRPSRFDCVIKIDLPSDNIREQFLIHKNGTSKGPNGEDLVALTKGFSISHIKELIIGVYCQQKPVMEVISKLRKMNDGDFSDTYKEDMIYEEPFYSDLVVKEKSHYIDESKLSQDAEKLFKKRSV